MIRKPLSDQKEVQYALKERITEPGIYICPYRPPDDTLFPDYGNEPIFAIKYTGLTHNTARGIFTFSLLLVFIAPMIAAWMLSVTSEKILSKYYRRVLFVMVLGIFLAVFGDLMRSSTESELTEYLIFLAINSIITWFLVGLVIAWRIKPKST